jgi:hypothetical protein
MSPEARNALKVSAVLLATILALVFIPLRLLIGPEWYSGEWKLGDQLAYAQSVIGTLTLVVAGGVGGYAVEQLRISQQAFKEEQRARAQAQQTLRQQLIDGVNALRQSIRENAIALAAWEDRLKRQRWQYQLGLDTTAWDAMKPMVASYLGDGALAADVASYFGRVDAFSRLLDLAISNLVTKEGIGLWGPTPVTKDLWEHLPLIANELGELGSKVEARLGDAIEHRLNAPLVP